MCDGTGSFRQVRDCGTNCGEDSRGSFSFEEGRGVGDHPERKAGPQHGAPTSNRDAGHGPCERHKINLSNRKQIISPRRTSQPPGPATAGTSAQCRGFSMWSEGGVEGALNLLFAFLLKDRSQPEAGATRSQSYITKYRQARRKADLWQRITAAVASRQTGSKCRRLVALHSLVWVHP